MKHLFAPAALLFLSACGTASAPIVAPAPASASAVASAPGGIQGLIQLIETTAPQKIAADLDAAASYAAAQNDILGAACYPSVKAWLASLPPLPAGKVSGAITARPPAPGAVTAFEYARIDRKAVEGSVSGWQAQIQAVMANGAPPALLLGCGGLAQDETNFFLRIAALLGVGAATANIAPLLAPALPALGGALPIPLALP